MNEKASDFYKEVGNPCTTCPPKGLDDPIYSHQVRLAKIKNNVSLQGIPYVIYKENELTEMLLAEQSLICKKGTYGETDNQGNIPRVYTKQPEELSFLVGKLASAWQHRQGNLGSLKNTDERIIKLKTDLDQPTHIQPYIDGYDYITIAGARTAPWESSLDKIGGSFFRGDSGRESKGNQYRFINHGLRQLRLFPKSTVKTQGDYTNQRILVVFKQGYTKKDIQRINKYAQNLDGQVVYVKNVSEFIAFLNQRKEKKRLIKELVIYCHGTLDGDNNNCSSFHYAGNDVESGGFYNRQIDEVLEEIFDYNAIVTNYACRSGISIDGKDLTDKDSGKDKSQAQKMANTWDVTVKAFEMRSSYAGKTYGKSDDIKKINQHGLEIEKYDLELKEYERKIDMGEFSEPPQKPDNYNEMKLKYYDIKTRDENQADGGGPIMPNGAWEDPGTGDTPKGLNAKLQTYRPKEWKV